MDITVDKTGHVLIGYADGCTAACVTSTKVTDNKNTALGVIAREVDGPLLFTSAPSVIPSPSLPEVRTPVALMLLALALGLGAFDWRRLRGDSSGRHPAV